MRIGGNSIIQVASGARQQSSAFASSDILAALGAGQVYGGTIAGTAAAANKAVCEINNPNGSNRALFIYELEIFAPTGMAVQLVLNGTTLAPAGVPPNLCSGSGNVTVARTGGGNQLATTGTVIKNLPTLAANTVYTFPQPWILELFPNNNLQIIGQTVNQALTVNFTLIDWTN
jgi:hypothetical protein